MTNERKTPAEEAEATCPECGYTWGHAWTCPVGTPVSGPNYAPVDDQERIDELEAGRDNWKKTACFHLRNEQYYHAQFDNARAWARLWKTSAKSYRLAYNFRLSLTKVWNKKFAELQDERDEQRRRADEATYLWGMIEVLMGAVEEERDDLRDQLEAAKSDAAAYFATSEMYKIDRNKLSSDVRLLSTWRDEAQAENARLRDRVQAFAEAAHRVGIRFTCSDLDRGVYADALNCLTAAMTDQEIGGDFSRPDAAVGGDPARFMPIPFTDDTTVSKHAPDVDHTFDLGGLMPLPLSVERIVNDTEPAQTEQD